MVSFDTILDNFGPTAAKSFRIGKFWYHFGSFRARRGEGSEQPHQKGFDTGRAPSNPTQQDAMGGDYKQPHPKERTGLDENDNQG